MRLVLSSFCDRATEDKRRKESLRRAAKTSRREDVATDATEPTQSDDDDIDVRAFLTSFFSQPPVAEVLGQVAEGLVDGVVPGPFKGVLGARAEHGLVRGERCLGRGGRRERVRERARGAPEGTLRRWADGACFVSGARGSGRESGAAVTSRARRARARDERGSDAPERGAARKPRASFDRSAFSTLTLENDRVAIGTARASARTHPNVQERERACGET